MGEVAIAVLMTYQIYSSERHQSTKSPSFDFLEPLKYKYRYCLDRFTKKSIDQCDLILPVVGEVKVKNSGNFA